MTGIVSRIMKAVQYIETNLDSDIPFGKVSGAACYSHYHFLRIFHALSGQTVGSYIKRRRLTKAAESLASSKTRIIEIALEAGFESQSAFTRAFTEMFDVSPAQFRKQNNAPAFRGQPIITETYLRHLQTEGITMKPRFEKIEAMTFIGLGKNYNLSGPNEIELLWDEFLPQKDKILFTQDKNAYGLCHAAKEKGTFSDQFRYTAALRVAQDASCPEGMERVFVPAQEYAIFIHKGTLETLSETNNYIWKTWLPKSDLDLADAPDIEVYGENWKDGNPLGEIEIWVPILRDA